MEKETTNIQISNVPNDLLEQAKFKALREKRALSEVVRELLQEWVEKQPIKEQEKKS